MSESVSHETVSFPIGNRKQKPYSELTPEERRKAICRSKANVNLRRGKIERKPCQVCGAAKSQMHHADYDKPLEITWLCKNCHLVVHGEVIGGKTTCCAPGCNQPHAPGNGYCRHHHNEHEKARAKANRAEFANLKAIAKGMGG